MARLTVEQVRDRARFQFARQEVELPGLDGSVLVKTLSVAERDRLPDLQENGGIPSVSDLADVAAAVVEDPHLTADEWKTFLGDWPADALDKVLLTFGELMGGTKEDHAAAGREFRPPGN